MSLAEHQRATVARLLSGRPGDGEAVHALNIRSALTDTLRVSFPVTETLVGVDFFRGLAVAFVAGNPPSRPVLAEYGEAFPPYLADHPVARELPYLPDVARLEWLRQAAYFAADDEPVGAEDLAALAESERAALRPKTHASVGLLDSPFPVFSIWAAHQPGGPALESIDAAGPGERGAVYRTGAMVHHLALDLATKALLQACDGGTELSAVLAALEPRFDGAALGRALAEALRAGLLTS